VPSVAGQLLASEGGQYSIYLGDDGVDGVEGRVVVWEL
jgi:hypothetical protein